MRRTLLRGALVPAALATVLGSEQPVSAQDLEALDGGIEAAREVDSPEARGKYILHASGCVTCHTADGDDSVALAGGRALETRFGTFHAPNITPDSESGIGGWSLEDFTRALKEGLAPDGSPYYPAFPYTSYAGMREQDIADLFAYLNVLEPVENAVPEHALAFPYNLRAALWPWRWLFFDADRAPPRREEDTAFNRGSYLVNTLGHCGECHTPRNRLGALQRGRHLAGNPDGPEDRGIPNITPHEDAGIGGWGRRDLTFFLQTGFFPDGDVAGGGMGAVIRDNTSNLSDSDRDAIAAYLRAIEAHPGVE